MKIKSAIKHVKIMLMVIVFALLKDDCMTLVSLSLIMNLKKLTNIYHKLGRLYNQRIYLLNSRREGLIPRHT